MAVPQGTIGIVSIGEMGAGIASLLLDHGYRVLTNVSDRSETTRARAISAGIELVDTDESLFTQSHYILSIVPPRDAISTARRFVNTFKSSTPPPKPMTRYVDLNAISPSTANEIAALFFPTPIRFIDGGIIGPAPKALPGAYWSQPSLVVSGPHQIHDDLAQALNALHVADTIGPASGLKMCFASMTKGLTAIAIQSFATAHNLGVLEQLQLHLKEYSPKTRELVARSLTGMPPKAYRWVDEMKEIATTFRDQGGFEQDMFTAVSEVYRFVAEETELGKERTESRKVGQTPEDVARRVAEGIERKKVKVE
ncbi:hypothetical protein ACLMJK_006534 [Lecanora helva]